MSKKHTVKRYNLNPSQVKILKLLSEYPDGLTREAIERLCDTVASPENLGPVFKETLPSHPHCLWYKGLAEPQMYSDGERLISEWIITEEGKEYAQTMKVRKSSIVGGRVPNEILDPIALSMKSQLTYGWERLTDEDVELIRKALPEEYHEISDDDLRQQIANRRKVGAFKKVKKVPRWYEEYRQTEEWLDKAKACIERYEGQCAINSNHTKGLRVYHRAMTCEIDPEDGGGIEPILYQERIEDLIPLCDSCYRKLEKALIPIPEDEPSLSSRWIG